MKEDHLICEFEPNDVPRHESLVRDRCEFLDLEWIDHASGEVLSLRCLRIGEDGVSVSDEDKIEWGLYADDVVLRNLFTAVGQSDCVPTFEACGRPKKIFPLLATGFSFLSCNDPRSTLEFS